MVVTFIPLRGGSKSIPLKNIKLLNGKPLAFWVLAASEKCTDIDKIVVATDSEEIKTTIQGFGFSKVEIYNRMQIMPRIIQIQKMLCLNTCLQAALMEMIHLF